MGLRYLVKTKQLFFLDCSLLLFPLPFLYLAEKSSMYKNIMKNKPFLLQATHLPSIAMTINSISESFMFFFFWARLGGAHL